MTDSELIQLSLELGDKLLSHHATVTAAESCTGGWIAKVLTDISGSSAWFETGFVTYSNSAKQALLGVNPDSLSQYGAVSEQVVKEMAAGACRAANADYAISVSGLAGPGGGSDALPAGTVWFAVASRSGAVFCTHQLFAGGREQVRRQATGFALKLLLAEVIKK